MPSQHLAKIHELPKLVTDLNASTHIQTKSDHRTHPHNDVQILLLKVKFYIELADGKLSQYKDAHQMARAALDIAVAHKDDTAIARSYFYIGETEAVRCKQGYKHYAMAKHCYQKALAGAGRYPYESNKALRRLKELDAIFPSGLISDGQSPNPWSAGATTQPSPQGEQLTPVQVGVAARWARVLEKQKAGHFERIPSYDSWHSDEDDHYQEELLSTEAVSSAQLSAFREGATWLGGPIVLSPMSMGQPPQNQQEASLHSVDENSDLNRDRKKSVSFAGSLNAGMSRATSTMSPIARRILQRRLTSPNGPSSCVQSPSSDVDLAFQ